MEITATLVKELRETTGVGMMDCKKSLIETEGDMEKAKDLLRKKGLATLAKRSDKIASEGIVGSYIHLGGKIGTLIEVNCETDFVAINEDFTVFVKDMTMQVRASNPLYVSIEDVPAELIAKEKEILAAQSDIMKKPEQMRDKIVEGRLNKFYEQVCILEQPFIKDPAIKVKDLIGQKVAKIGEKIVIRRFVRYVLGEGL